MSQTILDRPPPSADARIAYGEGEFQFADLRLPSRAGSHPCVVAIHGGFWRNRYSLDHLGHICAALAGLGLATWSLEYRRVGDPGGGWPGTFHDIAAGAAHVFCHAAEFGIDPARIAVLGHSAGGHLASWLATMANAPADSPIRAEPLDFCAAIPLAGVLDLHQGWKEHLGNGAVGEFMGGPLYKLLDRYEAASPSSLVPSPVPHLVVHGVEDAIVPVAMSERYVAAARH
ncbi:MAG: alpha/beta hydrolase, partial [Chloroflexia bacterium]|nr:alpha/beta hydrolase [Chloroflexia bacterium]